MSADTASSETFQMTFHYYYHHAVPIDTAILIATAKLVAEIWGLSTLILSPSWFHFDNQARRISLQLGTNFEMPQASL